MLHKEIWFSKRRITLDDGNGYLSGSQFTKNDKELLIKHGKATESDFELKK